MATTIVEQPVLIGFARTPILYVVYNDSLTGNTNFQYIADVYLWNDHESVPTTYNYELFKPPSTSDDSVVFDVRTLTSDYLSRPDLDYDSGHDDTHEMYVNLRVKFGYQYVNGSDVLITTRDVVTSSDIIILNGYNYYLEGVNYLPEDNAGTGYGNEYTRRVLTDVGIIENVEAIPSDFNLPTASGYFLTDRPLVNTIPEGAECHLFLYNNVAISPVKFAAVKAIFTDGVVSVQQTHRIDLSTVASKIAAIPSGSNEVEALFGITTMRAISWEVYGTDRFDQEVTKVYEFTVGSYCQWGFENLQFLNRYGVWEYIVFNGKKREQLEVTRAEIMHSPLLISKTGFNIDLAYGQFHMANVDGRESFEISTGWLEEAQNELLKQMLLSEYTFNADTYEPYTLDSKNIRFKTSLNDKLIEYTFSFKKGYTAVNTIY